MILMYMQGKFLLFYLASRKSAIMNFFSCTVSKQKRLVGPLSILMKQVPGVINTPGDPTRLFDSCQVTNNAKRIGATCYKYNERLNTHFFVCVKTPQFNGGLSLPIPWIKGYFISSSKNQIVCSPYLSIISLLPLERSISSNWFYQGLQAISSTFALP